uniref:Uncharacterized protein n=1 Tax=Arundo donax TaxID=35708 RepID=A0A0A8Y3R5_ARUDO
MAFSPPNATFKISGNIRCTRSFCYNVHKLNLVHWIQSKWPMVEEFSHSTWAGWRRSSLIPLGLA